MESNTWCPRLTAWIILSGSAVQVKGLGSALCSITKRLMAACKSTTDRKVPRFNRRSVSLAKKPSTALSEDAEPTIGAPSDACESVVVDDSVDFLSRRHLRLDGVEEADELLVPVTLH